MVTRFCALLAPFPAAAIAVAQAGPFGDQQVITNTASSAQSVYAADLDGDGDLDVLSASFGDDTVAWYENDGVGGFGGPQVITTTANGARCVFAADLDGDGDVDVLSASELDDTVAWYENDSTGSFGVPQLLSTTAAGARAVYAADVDADGDLDVISGASLNGRTTLYENDGAGGFGPGQVISTVPNSVYSVHAADLDADGDLDVLATHLTIFGVDTLAWYANDGVGNFGAQRVISTVPDGLWCVSTADLDGDGDQDVLSASISDFTIAWFANDGAGSFGPRQVITALAPGAADVYSADLDGDGDQDVLSVSFADDTVAWHENDGGGTFGARQVISTTADTPYSVHAADLDGDGDEDVLSASLLDDKIAWYENRFARPAETFGAGCAGLTLACDRLRLGASWTLSLDNIAPATLLGLFLFGSSANVPGAPLSASCAMHVVNDLGVGVQTTSAGSASYALVVPSAPTLLGFEVVVQGLAGSPDPSAWQAGFAQGLALSNGLRAAVGF